MTPPCVRASAPTRIDLAGGTLDIWPISQLVEGALTVNVAVELRARVEITTQRARRVQVVSLDRKQRATRSLPLGADDLGGSLSLLLRLVQAFAPRKGMRLESRATAPAGSGLGGSSSLAVAAGTALARWSGERIDRARLLRRVMNLETVHLRVPTGNQDYLAALHGGLAAYHHEPDGTRRENIPLPPGLESRLVLAYTGQPRNSGFSNWDMFRRFVDGERTTVRRMQRIAGLAREMRDALTAGDLDAVGRTLGEEGRLRYSLAPSVATESLRLADRAARKAGALGVKVCGAGGGGCLVALAREGKAGAVADAMASTGARILDAGIARRGVRVESFE